MTAARRGTRGGTQLMLLAALAALGCGSPPPSEASPEPEPEPAPAAEPAPAPDPPPAPVAPGPAPPIPLAGGRLRLSGGAPFFALGVVSPGAGPAPSEHFTVQLRYEEGETVRFFRIVGTDILEPMRLPLPEGSYFLRPDAYRALPSSDRRLLVLESQIAGRPVGEEHPPSSLRVLQDHSTTVLLRVEWIGAIPDEEVRTILETLARRLEPGAPLPTARRWSVSLGPLRIETELPEGYAVWSDAVMDEGIEWEIASHTAAPAAELRFTLGPPPPGTRFRGARRASLGDRAIELRGVQNELPRRWLADLGCSCPRRCTLELSGEEAELERLLEALSRAQVSDRFETREDVLLRSEPERGAEEVGRIWPHREVWVRERRGGWARVRGRSESSSPYVEGWVRASEIARNCD